MLDSLSPFLLNNKINFKDNFWCIDPLYTNLDPIEFDKDFDYQTQKNNNKGYSLMQPAPPPKAAMPPKKKGNSRPRKSKNIPIQEQNIIIHSSKESYEINPEQNQHPTEENNTNNSPLNENNIDDSNNQKPEIKPPLPILPPSGPHKPRPKHSQPQPPSDSHGRPRPTKSHKAKAEKHEMNEEANNNQEIVNQEQENEQQQPQEKPEEDEQQETQDNEPEVETNSEEITDESEEDDPFDQNAIQPGDEGADSKSVKGKTIPLTINNATHPLMPGSKFEFTLVLSPTAKKCEVFKFMDYNTQEVILFAKKELSFTSETYNIFLNEKEPRQIAKINSNFIRNLYYTWTVEEKPCEISAVRIKSAQNSVTHTQQLIAYLSPIGEHIPINQSQSVLAGKSSSKVVEYVSKLPKLKDGIPVLHFGERVKLQSVKNFILVSEQNMEEEVLTFGKSTPNSFAGEAYYPLSPLQAFSLCLPQFKF